MTDPTQQQREAFTAAWNARPWYLHDPTDKEIAEYWFKQGLNATPVPDCPYPCGWHELYRITVEMTARIARAEGYQRTLTDDANDQRFEALRQDGIQVGLELKTVCVAMLAASPKPEDRHD